MMWGESLGVKVGMKEELIKKAASQSMKAHKSSSSAQKPYLLEKSRGSPEALFCFGGSWTIDDWFARTPFGETKINAQMFSSIRSIGNDEVAKVNGAFLKRFEAILNGSSLQKELQERHQQRHQQIARAEKELACVPERSFGGGSAIVALMVVSPKTRVCVEFEGAEIGRGASSREKLACVRESSFVGDSEVVAWRGRSHQCRILGAELPKS